MRGETARPTGLGFVLFAALFFVNACSMERFEDFTVDAVSVEENGVIGTGKQSIEITFSKEVDELSADDAVRIVTDSAARVSVFRTTSGRRLVLEPELPWEPHERFWLVVSKEIKDIFGKEMGRNFTRVFQSTNELLRVSAALVRPEIARGVVRAPAGFFELVFNDGVDRESVERGFSLSPSVPGSFEWTSDRSFVFRLTESLSKNSLYTLQISDEGKDREGYPIKVFSRAFEYSPNEPSPAVETLRADGLTIFDARDPLTYRLENGAFVVEYPLAEKELRLRIDFSKPMDKTTLTENLRVVPFAGWTERWIDDRVVEIAFDERLAPGKTYVLKLGTGIKDDDGLGLRYDYFVFLTVGGPGSRFLEFYASAFGELEIAADLTAPSGDGTPVSTFMGTLTQSVDDDGDLLTITYRDSVLPEDVDVTLRVTLRFLHPSHVPVIDERSLQDAVRFSHILAVDPETGDKSGDIGSFTWTSDDTCVLQLDGLGSGNIYSISIDGGSGGVVDEQLNFLEEDHSYYFMLALVQGGGG
jgi:hypothetical protein